MIKVDLLNLENKLLNDHLCLYQITVRQITTVTSRCCGVVTTTLFKETIL